MCKMSPSGFGAVVSTFRPAFFLQNTQPIIGPIFLQCRENNWLKRGLQLSVQYFVFKKHLKE